jgi:hypothetical protein
MSDEPLNFEAHRRRRQADADVVPCAKCKTRIPALSTRCPECNVHFSGAAEDFVQESEGGRGTQTWVVVVAVVLLVVMLTSLLGGR